MTQSTQRFLPTLALACLLSVPLSAQADSQFERFEEISERGSEVTMELMVRQYASMGADAEAIRAAVPASEWDDEYREAARCQLDRYEASIGKSGIDEMLDRLEAMFEQLDNDSSTFDDMQALGEKSAIEGVSDQEQIAIMKDCGLMEINMRRMSESGFMEAVQAQMATMELPDES